MASSTGLRTTTLTSVVALGVALGGATAVAPITAGYADVATPAIELTADPIGAWLDLFSHTADSIGGLVAQAFQPLPQTLPDFAFPGALSMLSMAAYTPLLGVYAGASSVWDDAIMPVFGGDILAPLNALPYFLDGLINGLAPNNATPTLLLPLLPYGALVAIGGGFLTDLGLSDLTSTPPALIAGTISSLDAVLKNLIGFTETGTINPLAAVEPTELFGGSNLAELLNSIGSLDPTEILGSLAGLDFSEVLGFDLANLFDPGALLGLLGL